MHPFHQFIQKVQAVCEKNIWQNYISLRLKSIICVNVQQKQKVYWTYRFL